MSSDDLSDGRLTAQRDAPVGGQAVMEGVMMRGVSTWAVAVRRQSGTIDVESHPLVSWGRHHPALRWPVVRGVVALGQSLNIGFKALGISANAQQPEDAEPIGRATWAGTLALSLLFAVGLFFVVPVTLASLVKDQLGSAWLFWVVEGAIRTAIFLGYLGLMSRLRDLRRVFEYHGAEHKVISCFEAGEPLEPASAQRFSRLHPRCGTSFLLVVMIVAIFVFAPIGLPAWYVLVPTRILGVPLIAGLSFELIKWAGRNRSHGSVRAIMWPGMQLQRLTTREPDHEQLAVAIAALEAVLAVEDPRAAAAADRVGMEVVA
ncbi:MAG TPA: DUF1385 domain-containing protein [Solirubrobacteraceae bacterium]|nr:DUF1385 domain-containing protein [Solirubrobacteraceae bacterium]